MRIYLMSAVVAAVAVMVAQPALACTQMPSPRWDLVPQAEGPPLAIGRVVSDVPDGGDEWNDFVLAEIETLERLQGDVPERFTVRGIIEHRFDPETITLWCGQIMSEQPGDVVMALSRGEARFTLLTRQQIAEPFRQRMEAYEEQDALIPQVLQGL